MLTVIYDHEILSKIANGESFPARENPDEVIYIVSFPKSGRTWLRVILSRYKQQVVGISDFYLKLHDLFVTGADFSPQYIFSHANSGWENVYYETKHRFLATWLDFLGLYNGPVPSNFDLTVFRNSKIIFLLRDPRDVLVSSYYHNIYRQKFVFKMPKARYIRMRLYGLQRIIEFMNFLADNHSKHDHLIIRYEQILDQPHTEFEKILNFSGTKVNKEFIENAVSYGQFENMQKMESDNVYGDKLQQFDSNPQARKVRQGTKGSYKTEFSKQDIEYIEQYIQDQLDDFYSFYKTYTK